MAVNIRVALPTGNSPDEIHAAFRSLEMVDVEMDADKISKVTAAVAGKLAKFDADGDLEDSGWSIGELQAFAWFTR